MCPASAPTISNPFSAALMCPVMGKRQGLLQAAAGHGHGYTEAGQGGPSHLLHMRRVAWVRSTLEANCAHLPVPLMSSIMGTTACPGHLSRESHGGLQGKALCSCPRHLVVSDVESPGGDLPLCWGFTGSPRVRVLPGNVFSCAREPLVPG